MVPQTYLRSSSIKSFQDCQLRFFADFCLGLKFPSGPSAVSGTIVHEILEYLAHNQDTADEQIEDVCKEIYQQHIDKVDPSRVPKSSQRKTPEASIKAWIPYKKVKDSITNVLAMSPRSFDPRKMKVIATEQKYDVELPYPWAKYDFKFRGKHYQGQLKLKGSIDLIVETDNGIEIIDWKSGRSDDLATGEPKAFEDYADDIQLALYWMVARRYLNLDVQHITIVFMNESACYSVDFDDDLVMDRIQSIYETMKNTARPEKNDSLFCMRYCPFSKNDFTTITTKPLVKAREYTWTDEETGIPVNKVYKMCGQLNNYFNSDYTPLQVMEALTRFDHRIEDYVNT